RPGVALRGPTTRAMFAQSAGFVGGYLSSVPVDAGLAHGGVYPIIPTTWRPRARAALITRSTGPQSNAVGPDGCVSHQSTSVRSHVAPVATIPSSSRARSASDRPSSECPSANPPSTDVVGGFVVGGLVVGGLVVGGLVVGGLVV